MSRLQTIENALIAINETVFQELCDSFLAIRNTNYKAFSRIGSQSGKQKTTTGTPDSLFLLPNGKYLFVEHSTNITKGVSKLKEDVEKCLDTVKTGIPTEQIAEIVICINFNLKGTEFQELKDLLAKTRIALKINTLDSLSLELHLHHRDLVHQYLGLSLDTGQIVTIERFIEEYNKASKGVATPLDNVFLHREKESEELKESINSSDFIILTGTPGVGKTKLAIEAIKSFLALNQEYNAYCISYKNYNLLDDLYQYFDLDKDYILFVDDANRIDAFSQITGFYKASRKGKLKVIITVRDYAFQEISMLCHEFTPKRIDLAKLIDEQIVDIIKADPFGILNPDYQKEIVRIADGNPRLAIMSALLAKEKQNIRALTDVSDLFESYFSTFTKDHDEFAKKLNIKCLGLISFFYTIPYKDKELTTSILKDFEIDYSDFIDAIDKLDTLELVEVQYEHVKIPEQNLATYFFYRSFVKDELLSFDVLLNRYFDANQNRFRDCIIPANNTFGPNKVMNKLRPALQRHWKTIKTNEAQAYIFFSTFWYYLQTEVLEFVYNQVEALPEVAVEEYEVKYENNAFSYEKNKIIELLGKYFAYPYDNLHEIIDLVLEYTRKHPDHLPELIHKIKGTLTFDRDDELDFLRQTSLFGVLIKGVNNNDKLYSTVFFELANTFLCYTFHQTKGGRNHSITFYDYPIPNIESIQEFRSGIWNVLDSKFQLYPDKSFELLNSYASVRPDVNKEIMAFDIPFVLEIVNKHLSNDSFEHCRYVQDQIKWCKRRSVNHESFYELAKRFINPTYEMFLKIDWDRFRDKEMYEFENYREYEKLKENEIRSSFVFNSAEEIRPFYSDFVFLKNQAKNDWNYSNTLDFIIDENCSKNFDLGYKILELIIERGNEINYSPRIILWNQLKEDTKSKRIWDLIQSNIFKRKTDWQLSFYNCIDDSLINKQYAEAIIKTITEIESSTSLNFDRLERFLKIEPNLFQYILKTILEKNESGIVKIHLWDLLERHFDKLGDDITLIEKAYLQQDNLKDYFDYEGKGLLQILKRDPGFLIQYVENVFSNGMSRHRSNNPYLNVIWQVENIENQLNEVFDLVTKTEPYFGILEHFCNSFFLNLSEKDRPKADDFLKNYVRKNHNNSDKMNVVVDIARHSRKELFENILLLYISLNQNKESFSKIWWRGNGGTYSGNVIIGDIQAAEWRNILSIVEKSDVGFKLTPIKTYISDTIEGSLRCGDLERKRRFLERDF